MEFLNTREISTALWFFIVILWCLNKDNVSKSIVNAFKSFFKTIIILILESLAVYLIAACCVLSLFFHWGLNEIKTGVFWYLFVGVPAIFPYVTEKEQITPLKDWFFTNVTFIIILEFLISKYTFVLPIELIIVPVISILAGTMVVAQYKEEDHQVAKLLEWILIIVGVAIAYHAVVTFINDDTNDVRTILAELMLPVVLSLVTIPYFIGLFTYGAYQRAFSGFSILFDDEKKRSEAKWIAVKRFGLRINRLELWSRLLWEERPTNAFEVEGLVETAIKHEHAERNPVFVEYDDGWSPHIAKDFLLEEGYPIKRYHSIDDEWFGSSNIKDASKDFPQSLLWYLIDGSETAAKKLCLRLTVNDLKFLDEGLVLFREDMEVLSWKAEPDKTSPAIFDRLIHPECHEIIDGNTKFSMKYERFENGTLVIAEYTFSIERI